MRRRCARGQLCRRGGRTRATEQLVRTVIGIAELAHDVTAISFSVVGADASCADAPLVTRSVPLDGDPLAGVAQRFASALFLLPPGSYRVCATPLAAESPSAECQSTEGVATIVEGQTSDLLLIAQCSGDPAGGLGTIIALNDPPTINSVTLDPAQRLSVCETVTLSVLGSDPNGDNLTYSFAVAPGAGAPQLTQDGATARFWGSPGEYLVAVTATDSHGASTSLNIPISITDATCAVPTDVQAIFASRCGPCHTTGMSGSLKLDTASASYANLVSKPVRAMSCASGLLVAPQAPANSYLIAKLRALPGICGGLMPRNAPPLPEEEIVAIESWISALPK